jgi:uncharacterized membrane protein YqaE (UPF0057 family)
MTERWSPLAGVAAIVCIVAAFAVGGSTPDTKDSDAKITAYFASDSHQAKQMVALLVFAVGILFLIAFLSVLRDRLGSDLVFGAGIASAVLLFVAVVCFAGPALAADDTSRFHLDPNTYRLLNDMGYGFWVGGVMIGAIVVWAASASPAGVFPRWFAVAGRVVGVILLFALFFIPGFVYALWLLVASVLLARSERRSVAPVPQPA